MAAIRQLVGIDKDQELLEAAKSGRCDVIEKLLKKTSGSSLLNFRLVSLGPLSHLTGIIHCITLQDQGFTHVILHQPLQLHVLFPYYLTLLYAYAYALGIKPLQHGVNMHTYTLQHTT